jgi:Icc protein
MNIGRPVRIAVLLALAAALADAQSSFRFALLGDRTGESQPGVFEQILKETAAESPSFVVSAGDTIQGTDDATAETQWREFKKLWAPYTRFPLFLTPGNHDIWSEASEKLFRKYAGHPPHYSFDHEQVHFTILDNSRSEKLSAEELAFLEKDLAAHAAQPVKFIVSHRPSWLIEAAFNNPRFPLHQIAKKYGVRFVIAGHVHQMMRFELEGITYLSLPSAGGHLRGSLKYEDGWFFAHTRAEVKGSEVEFHIEEVRAPYGLGRTTTPANWGKAGLSKEVATDHFR